MDLAGKQDGVLQMVIGKSMTKSVKSFMVKALLSRKKLEKGILISSILNSNENEVVQFDVNDSKLMSQVASTR